ASVHAMTTPLLTDENGQMYGKSEGNAIWLSADMTTPYAFYQYWINVADSEVVKLLKVFTTRSAAEIADLEQATQERPHSREAQHCLAADVTTLAHGAEATAQVQAASAVLFGKGDPADLDAGTLTDAIAELPGAEVPLEATIVDALVATGLAESRGAARRLIGEGGVS